jgi:type VI secretion system protein
MFGSLFEKLTGTFSNGIPFDAVPKHLREVYSMRDYLQRIFEATPGSCITAPKFGFPVIYDVYSRVPENTKPLEKLIQTAILDNEPSIKEVVVANWNIDKKDASLCCVIACVLRRDSKIVYRFRLRLRGTGGHRVEMWKGGS